MIRLLLSRRGDEFAQSAIVLPLILLASLFLMSMTMAGFASVNANNAANVGARVGSVTQRGAGRAAYAAALESISNAPIGDYRVDVSGGGGPGARIAVQVHWRVPNFFNSLVRFYGGDPVQLRGSATSTFRQEGW